MLSRILVSFTLLTVVCAFSACTSPDEAEDGETDSFAADGKTDFGFPISGQQACGMLRAANEATVGELDNDAALTTRAAQNIVAGRASGPYQTLAALDAVPYVGPVAAEKLLQYATARGFVATCGAASTCVASAWSTEQDMTFSTGVREPHLMIDASGGQYLLFRTNLTNSPYYVRYRPANGDWGAAELVEKTTGELYNPSWAFAPDGTIYVTFSEVYYIYQHVVVAHRDAAGTWSATRPALLEGAHLGQLVVDADGLHLSLHTSPLSEFAYATRPFTGNWSVETVDSDVLGARSAMVIVDKTVHVVYADSSQNLDPFGVLKYARRSPSGTWTKEVLRHGMNGDDHLALAVTGGSVYLAFQNGIGEVHYQRRSSAGTWTDETVGKNAAIARDGVSLAVDHAGTVRLAYGTYDYGTRMGTLNYALRPATASTWDITPLGQSDNYQPQTALAVDGGGIAHLVYQPANDQMRRLRVGAVCDAP